MYFSFQYLNLECFQVLIYANVLMDYMATDVLDSFTSFQYFVKIFPPLWNIFVAEFQVQLSLKFKGKYKLIKHISHIWILDGNLLC